MASTKAMANSNIQTEVSSQVDSKGESPFKVGSSIKTKTSMKEPSTIVSLKAKDVGSIPKGCLRGISRMEIS